MARVVQYSETGSPDVLTIAEVPDPQPAPGELGIVVTAIGVNPLDAKLRAGLRPGGAFTGPRRVGFDAAGVVDALGEGVTEFAVGDRVVWSHGPGAYATQVTVPAAKAVTIPAGVSDAQAAALPIPVGTAYQVLRSLDIGKGDVLVYHGASGAVGQAAIQLARRMKAQVLATASPNNHDVLRELGAEPVDYADADAVELATRLLDAEPAAITAIIDGVGTDVAIESSIKLLADKQRIATIVRGADAPGYGIRAFSGGSAEPLTDREQAWRAEALPLVLGLIADGTFRVQLGPEFSLDEASDAHRLIESGHPGGKIIVRP